MPNCIICQIDKLLYNIIDDYHVCLHCFHVIKDSEHNEHSEQNDHEGHNDKIKEKEMKKYFYKIFNYKPRKSTVNYVEDESFYTEYLFGEIESLIKSRPSGSPKLKIASIDANNTFILDEIRKRFDVNTTSISENFNPSYFSPHKCYKLPLEIYANNYNLQECNYDSFDIIILNDMLHYVDNPVDILNKCKRVCNKNAQIYSVNLHTSILVSLNYININRNINHIFNTNSMKTTCKYSHLVLDNSFFINNDKNCNTQIYKIINNQNEDEDERIPNQNIVESLYDEICLGLYNITPYYYIRDYWDTYFQMCNITFNKYRNKNFRIIGIRDSLRMVNNSIEIDEYIYEIDIDEMKKCIKDLYKDDNVLFVILNYKKYQIIYDKLNSHLTSRNHLILDMANLIVS